MLFDDDFIKSIPSEPLGSVGFICRSALDQIAAEGGDWSSEERDVLFEAYALLNAIVESDLVPGLKAVPDVTGEESDCIAIFSYLQEVQESVESQVSMQKIEKLKNSFKDRLGVGFVYEFSQGDLDQVHALLSELRKLIAESKLFTSEHRQRLLSRLESLQGEVHKKMSSLDRLWGIVGDAGVVLGKFGEDVKPLVDRIKQLTEITWRTQARAENLPSDSPGPLGNSALTKLPDSRD